ncbi:MAG: hypothetical protein KAI17_01645 [Thiotrichaceae bacterium]|nr:hypothetical protein [Thiotrichaceae bacterium]
MPTKNRDDFNQCVALVFGLLFKSFPRERELLVDELVADVDMMDNYLATIRFLQREALISYQELYFSTFKGVVLTAKGLKVLDTKEEEETLVQKINDALLDGDKTEIASLIQSVINFSVI